MQCEASDGWTDGGIDGEVEARVFLAIFYTLYLNQRLMTFRRRPTRVGPTQDEV